MSDQVDSSQALTNQRTSTHFSMLVYIISRCSKKKDFRFGTLTATSHSGRICICYIPQRMAQVWSTGTDWLDIVGKMGAVSIVGSSVVEKHMVSITTQFSSNQGTGVLQVVTIPMSTYLIFRRVALCYSLPPYSWYLLVVFLSPFSCPFRYVFLRLGSLPDPLEST